MARALRIQYPGAAYHITSRGNERKAIFKSRRDREKFVDYLQAATQRYGEPLIQVCGHHPQGLLVKDGDIL